MPKRTRIDELLESAIRSLASLITAETKPVAIAVTALERTKRKTRRFSAEARAKMAAAGRKRWAAWRREKARLEKRPAAKARKKS